MPETEAPDNHRINSNKVLPLYMPYTFTSIHLCHESVTVIIFFGRCGAFCCCTGSINDLHPPIADKLHPCVENKSRPISQLAANLSVYGAPDYRRRKPSEDLKQAVIHRARVNRKKQKYALPSKVNFFKSGPYGEPDLMHTVARRSVSLIMLHINQRLPGFL